MNRFNFFISIFFFASVAVSCKTNTQPNKTASVEDFEKFHRKFYSDSVFQINRIVFPLLGTDSDIIYGDETVKDQENDTFFIKNNKLFWKKKSWKFINAPFQNKQFSVTLDKQGSIMREQIRSKDTDLVITLKFSLIDNKWMLSYFSHEWY